MFATNQLPDEATHKTTEDSGEGWWWYYKDRDDDLDDNNEKENVDDYICLNRW